MQEYNNTGSYPDSVRAARIKVRQSTVIRVCQEYTCRCPMYPMECVITCMVVMWTVPASFVLVGVWMLVR